MSELFLEQSAGVLEEWETTAAGLHTHRHGDAMRWRPDPPDEDRPRLVPSFEQELRASRRGQVVVSLIGDGPFMLISIEPNFEPMMRAMAQIGQAIVAMVPAMRGMAAALGMPRQRHDMHHPRPLCIDGAEYARRRRARARRRR